MSSKSFIVAIACLLLALGGFVSYTMLSGSHQASDSSNQLGTSVRENEEERLLVRQPPTSLVRNLIPEQTELSERLKGLVDDSLPEHVRLDIAREIDTDLSADDIAYLFKILHNAPANHAKETWWVVMNEIMEQMRKKNVAPKLFGQEMLSLVNDSNQAEVVRDYAVQHLSQWVAPPTSATPSEPSAELVSMSLQAIASTVIDPSIAHTSIPGTSIMALTTAATHLPSETMEPVWQKLDPAMTSILKGEMAAPLATRTTVIQALAMQGSEAHLPLVQAMARDESINPSLRLSSIAALGIYRSESDRAYLQKVAQSSSKFRHAAQSSLNKF